MVMRSENWPDELEPGLAKMYKDEYELIQPQMPNLYSVETATTSYDKRSGVGAYGSIAAHSGTVDYQDLTQKYDKTTTFTPYSGGIKIARELNDDQLYHSFDNLAKSLGFAMAYRREEDAASIFNEAATSTPSDGDGVPLLSASHPSNAPGVAVQSNKGSSAVSPTSVAATRLLMRDFRNDQGQRIMVKGSMIVCSPDKEQTVWEIIKTPGKVNTADNDLNFLKGRYKLVAWDFLRDSNDWFMIDERYMKMFLIWFNRIETEFGQDKDSDTFNAKYFAYMRYGFNFYDWIWTYGHVVS